MKKNIYLYLSIIILIAFVVRLVFLIEFNKSPYSSEELLMVDAESYDSWGENIAKGDLLGKKVFCQSPLYPYFWVSYINYLVINYLL